MNETILNKTTKKNKWRWIIICLFIIATAILILKFYPFKPQKEIYITYVSISTHKDYAYLNLDVETNTDITFHKSDFSILKNEIPNEVNGFVTSINSTVNIGNGGGISTIYTIGNSFSLNKNGTILISLNIKTSELKNEIFLYKGQHLNLGEKMKIN